jgi:putative tryptophan/tyrosine transport system substrate-binding protein
MKRTSLPLQRREFITLLGGAAAAWPLTARAQQPAMPVIGYLSAASPGDAVRGRLAALRQALAEAGYVEGRNVAIEGRFDRLPELVADLVRRQVSVMIVVSDPGAVAAKAATTTIPIVFGISEDPVALGLVANIARPGGNVTGVNFLAAELVAKRMGVLRELLPAATRFGVLVNPSDPRRNSRVRSLWSPRAGALIVLPDPLLYGQHRRIVTFTTAAHLPAIFPEKEVVEAGGLIAYGPSIPASFRRAAGYVDKILRGAKPADLPVEQPTTFELAVNLQTARAIGVTVPTSILVRADEVIE